MTTAPAHPYIVYRTRAEFGDGTLSADVWRRVPRTQRFVDVLGGTPALYDTTAALLWDDRNLYVGIWCESPFVEARVSVRDELVCVESDVEVFIDGGDAYYELQLNARNTVYEVFYIWKDAYVRADASTYPNSTYGMPARSPTTPITTTPPTASGRVHIRAATGGRFDWDFPGLQTAVHVRGTINDPTVEDEGWTAEIAFPWDGMSWLADGKSLPPNPGDAWRISPARDEKLRIGGDDVFAGWLSTRIGSVDNHRPERFMEAILSDHLVEQLTSDASTQRW